MKKGRFSLELHPKRAELIAEELVCKLKNGGIFNRKELPDDKIRKFSDRNSEEYIAIISFVTALDYMRDANKLWDSAIETINDNECNWVFNPSEVLKRGKEDLKEALLKHKLAAKKEKDTDIWWNISKTVSEDFNGNFLNLFDNFKFEVDNMYEEFLDEKWKKKIPNLSGRKIFPLWIRSIKDKVENLNFKNVEKLPIPVDVHVARATFTTGCITGKYKAKSITESLKKLITQVWEEGLKEENIAPIEMFRPLWLLSKYGCHYRKNGNCPKKKDCPVKNMCVDGVVHISASKVEIDTKLT